MLVVTVELFSQLLVFSRRFRQVPIHPVDLYGIVPTADGILGE